MVGLIVKAMKEKVKKFIFSVFAGIGFSVSLVFITAWISFDVFNTGEDTVAIILAIMGATFLFTTITHHFYKHF